MPEVGYRFTGNSRSAVVAADELKAALSGVGAEAKQVSAGNVRLTQTHDSAGKAAGKHSSHLRDLAKSAVAVGAAYFGAQGLISVGKSSVDLFNEQQLAASRLRAEFGQGAVAIEKWSKTTAASIGLWSGAAEKATADVGRMLEGLGAAPAKAAPMSKTLVELAAKMALLRQKDPEEVLRAFTAAMAGRGIALRRLGIDISKAAIEQEAARLGLIKHTVTVQAVGEAETRLAIARAKLADVSKRYGANTTQVASAQLSVQKAEDAVAKATAGKNVQLDRATTMTAAYSLIQQRGTAINKEYAKSQGDQAIQSQKLHAEVKQLEESIGAALEPTVKRMTDTAVKWLGNSKNIERVQKDVKVAVDDVTAVVKTAYTWANNIAGAVGGWKHALELLLALKVASTVSGWLGPISKLIGGKGGGGLLGAESAASGLRGQLAYLSKLGAVGISIPIYLNIIEDIKKSGVGAVLGDTLKYGLFGLVPGAAALAAAEKLFGGGAANASGTKAANEQRKKARIAWLKAHGGKHLSGDEWELHGTVVNVATGSVDSGPGSITNQAGSVNAGGKAGSQRGMNPAGAPPGYTGDTRYAPPVRGGLATQRIDMGLDFSGSAPIYSLGPGRVSQVIRNDPGWYGAYISVVLTDGERVGWTFFVAEHITIPKNIQVGTPVDKNTIIAYAHGGIEMGWAAGPKDSNTLAHKHGTQNKSGDPGLYATPEGRDFARFAFGITGDTPGTRDRPGDPGATRSVPGNLTVGHPPHHSKTSLPPAISAAVRQQIATIDLEIAKATDDPTREKLLGEKLDILSKLAADLKARAAHSTGKLRQQLEMAAITVEHEMATVDSQLGRYVARESKALWGGIAKSISATISDSFKTVGAGLKDTLDTFVRNSQRDLARAEGSLAKMAKRFAKDFQSVQQGFSNLSSGTVYTPEQITGPGGVKITVQSRRDATLADWMRERDEIANAIVRLQADRAMLVRGLKRARRPHSKYTPEDRKGIVAKYLVEKAAIDQDLIQLGQDYADVIYSIKEILDQANQAAAAKTPEGQAAPTLTYDVATGKLYLNGQEITPDQGAAQVAADTSNPDDPSVAVTGSLFSSDPSQNPTPGAGPPPPGTGMGGPDYSGRQFTDSLSGSGAVGGGGGGGGGGDIKGRTGVGPTGAANPGPYSGPPQNKGTKKIDPTTGQSDTPPGRAGAMLANDYGADNTPANENLQAALAGELGPRAQAEAAVRHTTVDGVELHASTINERAGWLGGLVNQWKRMFPDFTFEEGTPGEQISWMAAAARLPGRGQEIPGLILRSRGLTGKNSPIERLTSHAVHGGYSYRNPMATDKSGRFNPYDPHNQAGNPHYYPSYDWGGFSPGGLATTLPGEMYVTPYQQRKLAEVIGIGKSPGQQPTSTTVTGGGNTFVFHFHGLDTSDPAAVEAFARKVKPVLDRYTSIKTGL